MGVQLDQKEIDDFLTKGHTVIFTTIDRDGYPHSTPLWYAYLDGSIYVRFMNTSQKAKNLAKGQKVCCLVETGERWRDLMAVMVRGRAELVKDPAVIEGYERAAKEKYAAFREASTNQPQRTREHYSNPRVYYRIVPEKKIGTWDNKKIRLLKRD